MEELISNTAGAGIRWGINQGMLPPVAMRFRHLVADDISRRLQPAPLDKELLVRHLHAIRLNALDFLQATLARSRTT